MGIGFLQLHCGPVVYLPLLVSITDILINCWFIALNRILITPVHYVYGTGCAVVKWFKWGGLGGEASARRGSEAFVKRVKWILFGPANNYNWCRFVVIHWPDDDDHYRNEISVLVIFAWGYDNNNSNNNRPDQIHATRCHQIYDNLVIAICTSLLSAAIRRLRLLFT